MDAKKAAQNGTTLLEAMVAVALLGIAGGILFKSISSFLLSGKAIQSANAYQNVESFVQGVLTTQLRTYMTNPSPCAKPFGINVADVG